MDRGDSVCDYPSSDSPILGADRSRPAYVWGQRETFFADRLQPKKLKLGECLAVDDIGLGFRAACPSPFG